MEIIIKTPKEMQKVAKILAREICRSGGKKQRALVIALQGELGAGKTTFAKGFALGLGIKEDVSSPTFLIMKKIELREYALKATKHKLQAKFLYHLDCYRLKDEKDLVDLGIKEILADPQNIVIIEWAERVKKILPKDAIRISFKYVDRRERVIKIDFN